jgi:NAD(P)H-nitrite reductase large subunit
MDRRRVVIVGCGLAGITAAESARQADPDAEITVVERSDKEPYSRCGLPYLLSGKLSTADLVLKNHEFISNILKVRLVKGRSVSFIDRMNRRVIFDRPEGLEGAEYDSLIIATGSTFSQIPIPGAGKHGILRFYTLEDAERVSRLCKTAKTALILGSGPVALELAESLSTRVKPIVVSEEKEVLSGLLAEGAGRFVRSLLEERGIEFILGRKVERFVGFDEVKGVVAGGEVFTSDVVIVTGYLQPDIELAKEAGLKIGDCGRILVDKGARTSDECIYAAGEAAEVYSSAMGCNVPLQLASLAVRSGLVAGCNAANGHLNMPDVVRSISFRVDGVDVCCVGLNDSEVEAQGLETVKCENSEYQFANYYPGGKNLYARLIVDVSGSLRGAQFVGPSASVWADLAAMMIAKGLPIEYLSELETSFSPLTQPYWPSPVLAARWVAGQIRSGKRI